MAMSERDREAYERAKALWHYQMVRLDHDDAEALRALAKRRKTTVAELIRMFVAWGLEDGDYGGADKD
jgi:Ribbon-helix-helix protein, copG family